MTHVGPEARALRTTTLYPPSQRSTWKAWQAKLQQHLDMHALEDQAFEHQHLTLLIKVIMIELHIEIH